MVVESNNLVLKSILLPFPKKRYRSAKITPKNSTFRLENYPASGPVWNQFWGTRQTAESLSKMIIKDCMQLTLSGPWKRWESLSTWPFGRKLYERIRIRWSFTLPSYRGLTTFFRPIFYKLETMIQFVRWWFQTMIHTRKIRKLSGCQIDSQRLFIFLKMSSRVRLKRTSIQGVTLFTKISR